MPKVWKIAAATWLALFIIAGQAHATERFTPERRHRECRFESWNGERGFTDHEVTMLIDCAVDHFTDLAQHRSLRGEPRKRPRVPRR